MNNKYKLSFTILLLLFAFIQARAKSSPENKTKNITIISGSFQSEIGDTVVLRIWNDLFSKDQMDFVPYREFKCKLVNNKYKFNVDRITSKAYISLYASSQFRDKFIGLLDLYLIERGDDVLIQETKRDGHIVKVKGGPSRCDDCSMFSFSGRGAIKFKCKWDLQESKNNSWEAGAQNFVSIDDNSLLQRMRYAFELNSLVIKNGQKILDGYKSKLTPEIYKIIQADLYAESGREAYGAIGFTIKPTYQQEYTAEDITKAKAYYELNAKNFANASEKNNETLFSAFYPEMQIYKAKIEAILFERDVYNILQKRFTGIKRDRIFAAFFFDDPKMSDVEKKIKTALQLVNTNAYRKFLESIYKQVSVGTLVYDFALADSTGKIFRLSDFRGKTVFIDFFFVGCSGCSAYFQQKLSKVEERFKGNPAIVFLTVSIDVDQAVWKKKGLKSGIYTSDLAINLNTGKLGFNHPVIKQLLVQSYPNPLLIDKEGSILINDKERLFNASVDELINTIQSAINAKSKQN